VSFSLYRRTRSARLRVTTPDGVVVTAENLQGDVGPGIEFECKRSMDEYPGEFTLRAYNLPAEALGVIEYAQVRRVDDLDRMLQGVILKTGQVNPQADDALAAGFCIVELEAGYDGVMSRIFRAVGSRIRTRRIDGDLTDETTIEAAEDLDAVLLGVPLRSFPPGASTFELVDYLRQIAGLGPGNLSPANLAALLGESRLNSGYHCSGGQALSHLKNVLQYLPLRWFIDDREMWICGRDDVPNTGGVPAYVADFIAEPDLLLSRPERADGGRVRIECLLCPRVRVGRLVRLTPAGLALALQGLSPSQQQQAYAMVPPGLYRLDEVEHKGSTSSGDWTTTMLLRPGVAVL
jgi:hypothetical protein